MFGPFSYRYIDSKQMLICKNHLGVRLRVGSLSFSLRLALSVV